MGLRAINIQKTIIKEGAYIGRVGAFCGIVLSGIILYLQETYHFIRLSNDIYFMNYLPVSFNKFSFFFYPSVGLLFSLLIAFIPASKISNYSPASVLMYE